ncbi:MAG: hypothetical protein MI862_15175 [Desulfobacterales bacterium]|nr:hypothetical protein [Desulfobacterales bacterium]
MVKMIGSLIIIISGLIGGRLMGYQFQQRARELKEFHSALHLLETEISYGHTLLPIAVERLANISPQPHKNYFNLFYKYLMNFQGLTADEAWMKTIKETARNFCLKNEDWEVLKLYGRGLGSSDDQNQIRQIKVAQKRLEQLEEKASSESEKMSKLWNYIGILTGMALVILLY